LPTEDKHTYRRTYVESQIAVLMGGRVAEELIQDGDITTGAGNDIERATHMARQMVCDWGMSNLGPLALGQKEEPVFLGRDYVQQRDYSEATALEIDKEIGRFVTEGLEKAREILTEYREVLDRVAQELLERESLEGWEVYDMILEITGKDLAPESVKRAKESSRRGGPKPTALAPSAEADEPEEDAEPGLTNGSLSPAPT
jgi:cell division protease FtsH